MAQIKLLTIPFLDTNYNNVIDFENKTQMINFFKNKNGLLFDRNIKAHSTLNSIAISKSINELQTFDYLIVDYKYFYFIVSKQVINDNNTTLYLKLDVFNTYYYDTYFMPSFVDRCHVPRWIDDLPTFNIEDEGVNYGDYVQKSKEVIGKHNDSLVVISSVPMGKVFTRTADIGGSGILWEEGKLSAKGFRFIKGFEGFAPYKYQDSGGYWTIAYGVTKHGEPTIYSELVAQQPVDEETGAKVSYDLKNKNYGSKILSAFKGMGLDKQCQFDALVSVAYNCGVGAITGDNTLTRALVENINDKEYVRRVWENFKITSNGVVLEGLKARRKEECKMFFDEEYEVRSIATLDSSGNINGTVTENNGNGWLPNEEETDLNGYKSFNNELGNGWLCPIKGGTVTSVYGWRTHPISGTKKFHHGTDIGVAQGTPTVASKSGTIIKTGYDESMGNYIFLETSEGYVVRYMHLSQILVSVGDKVTRGQEVGKIGSTGSSTGPHAHWEIRDTNGESINPAPSLKKGDKV